MPAPDLPPNPRTTRKRSRRSRRLRHNAVILTAGLPVAAALILALPGDVVISQTASAVLGYLSFALLLVSLAIGPRNVLLKRRNPLSNDLRRDVGIWAGLSGVAHVVLALQHHFGGAVVRYFFLPGRLSPATVRRDAFGLSSGIGLAATALLVLLLAISNDRSLRRLGRRWKTLQRMNYFLAVLSAAHMALFWFLLRRSPPIVMIAVIATVGVAALQGLGVVRHRRDKAAPGLRPA